MINFSALKFWKPAVNNSNEQNTEQFSKPTKVMTYDHLLIWVTAALLLFGIVMVYSASIALSESPKFKNIAPTHFFVRQVAYVIVGVLFALVLFRIPMKTWKKLAPWMLIAGILLLVIVLIPGIGKEINGARRWLSLRVFNIQPSELMKLGILFYAANYTVRKYEEEVIHRLTKGFLPMCMVLMLIGVLLLLEPDLGAFGVIVCIAMAVLFLGGINLIWFFGIAAMLVLTFVGVILSSPWRRGRIFAYLDPWSEQNVLGKGYQLSHSLIAYGRGEISGVGLGGSIEKLHYLPEAHTDFIMAVVGEEFGFIGVVAVLFLFLWIVRRAFDIGRQAISLGQLFSGLVAKGIGVWIGVQVFINIGVTLGLLPTKGLTLPLMSYGGSSILVNCIAIAVLLRVDYENRLLMRGKV